MSAANVSRYCGVTGNYLNTLKEKIAAHSAKVAVIGLGYVGLPLGVEKGKVGFDVIGIDQNKKRVGQVNEGKNYIKDVKDDELKTLVKSKKLQATDDFSVLRDVDCIIICVPTPLTEMRDPDISYIVNVTREIAKYLRPGQLVTLESTTYPGTTEEVVLPLLETSGLKVGEDFFLAFSPERVDPGNKRFTTKNTSKVVGGVTPKCLEVAQSFYAQTIINVVPVSSPAVAEMTKVFENTYRAVNIALVNELMLLCDRMGLDIWEVVDAAATKPFGIHTFYPGPGVGGHCIPIDPFYLTWKAREYNFHTRFIELAGEINVQIPYHVTSKVQQALNERKKCMNGAKILVLGVTYKKDIEDVRESPALKVIELLAETKAKIVYNDPYVPILDMKKAGLGEISSKELTEKLLEDADCVTILTDHSSYDFDWVVEHAQVVVDARNGTKLVEKNRDKIVKI